MKDADAPALLERLSAVPYVGGYKPPLSEVVVPVHDDSQASHGLNLYTSGHGPYAVVADMDGRALHEWTYPFRKAFPDRTLDPEDDYFRRAYLFPNGDLIAIFEGRGLIKLDRRSNLLWKNPIAAHHDLVILPDGAIVVLTRDLRTVRYGTRVRRILDDFITVLGPDGRERRRISVFDALANSRFASLLRMALSASTADVLHTNTISIVPAPAASRPAWHRGGNLMISVLMLDLIAVVDADRATVVEAWTGQFRRQHDPKLLPNGNILLFDNQGLGSRSRVLEFDPVANQLRWAYEGSDSSPFFSRTCGAVQRLANGNTLVTESDSGRAFEVTAAGHIVWEFHSPHRVGRRREYVAALLAMTRLPREFAAEVVGRH